MGYTVNQDGTVTRDHVPSSLTNSPIIDPNESGSDSNGGCLSNIIGIIIVGIVLLVAVNWENTSNNDSVYTDSIIADSTNGDMRTNSVIEKPTNNHVVSEIPVEEPNEIIEVVPASLSVSSSNISLGWESQSLTINVYSTSDWWIEEEPDSWIDYDCYGTQITLYVAENEEEGSRNDYFVVKNAEGLSKKITIYQE